MRALILVDIQNDFTTGSLAVPRGGEVIAVANRLMPEFDLVVATQDFHPRGHQSFASSHPGQSVGTVIDLNGTPQVLWPDHCVQGTFGAELCADLNHAAIDAVIPKGTDPQIDSYSGFFDNDRQAATGLESWLRERDVTEVHLVGLATDYCVKATALDAAALGFATTVHLEGCRAVNLKPGDDARAVAEMEAAGVKITNESTFYRSKP